MAAEQVEVTGIKAMNPRVKKLVADSRGTAQPGLNGQDIPARDNATYAVASKLEADKDNLAIESCRKRLRESKAPSLSRTIRNSCFQVSFLIGAYVMDW